MTASFPVPLDVLKKLGNGDAALGVAVLRDALGGQPIVEASLLPQTC